jgi:hypothetical protein
MISSHRAIAAMLYALGGMMPTVIHEDLPVRRKIRIYSHCDGRAARNRRNKRRASNKNARQARKRNRV